MRATQIIIIALLAGIFLPILSHGSNFTDKIAEKLPFSLLHKEYEIDITPENNSLEKTLTQHIDLQISQLKEEGITDIDKRAQLLEKFILEILRSEGFYDGTVTYKIDSSGNPAVTNFNIKTQKPFIIKKTNIVDNTKKIKPEIPAEIDPGQVFKAANLIKAKEKITKDIEKDYCFYNIAVEHEALIMHGKNEVELNINIANSEPAKFGKITSEGLTKIDSDYVVNNIDIKQGDCFKRSEIEKAKIKLLTTNLFASADSDIGPIDKNGEVPVTFNMAERKHKTIKAGIGYNTDESLILSAGWEHRNIFGNGQKLDLSAKTSSISHVADAELTIPEFIQKKQNLIIKTTFSEESPAAFDSTSFVTTATIKRPLFKNTTGSIGTGYKLAKIDDNGEISNFGLFLVPIGIEYDSRDNILDPKKGFRTGFSTQPTWDTFGNNTGYIKNVLSANFYHSFDIKFQPTLGFRAAVGSIVGMPLNAIPADERFYAGGGGSVRGYPYQKIGQLDGEDPVGGRSFMDGSIENRIVFNKTWGGVVFLDAGNAYETPTPQGEGLKYAAGFGVRYFTDFAPIRFDIAFPLERRTGIDDPFQFYVSIGQAF
jgi:translocation and assembly module TamA